MTPRNLFTPLASPPPGEVVEELLRGGGFRLERIVSTGQATPPGQWYDQPGAEFVTLLSGSAVLRFESPDEMVNLRPGDWLLIPARRRHRVEATVADGETVWLALHYDADPG